MKMNNHQMKEVTKNLNNFSAKCPICGHEVLVVSDRIFELRDFSDGNLIIGGNSSVMPVVVASCENCGHLDMFSAIKLGAIDTSEKKVNDGEK